MLPLASRLIRLRLPILLIRSKTLPTGQRQWDGLTDDPAVSDAREAARRRSKAKARALATSVDPIDELKWNVNLAAERQVLAGDPQSWASAI